MDAKLSFCEGSTAIAGGQTITFTLTTGSVMSYNGINLGALSYDMWGTRRDTYPTDFRGNELFLNILVTSNAVKSSGLSNVHTLTIDTYSGAVGSPYTQATLLWSTGALPYSAWSVGGTKLYQKALSLQGVKNPVISLLYTVSTIATAETSIVTHINSWIGFDAEFGSMDPGIFTHGVVH
jgi:hypothetical protein